MADVDVIIVPVQIKDGKDTENATERLRDLRNAGWQWAVAGGGTGLGFRDTAGFVILERPKPQV